MRQVQLQLSDQLYAQAKRRAGEAGFESVDDYIADVVTDELTEDTKKFGHLFVTDDQGNVTTMKRLH